MKNISVYTVEDISTNAEQIFAEVKKQKIGVIEKDGKKECVLMAPAFFSEILNKIEDSEDFLLALERLEKYNLSDVLSAEEVFGNEK